MVRVQIGFDEKLLNEIDESWIVHHINARKHDGVNITIKVFIESGDIYMTLSTPGSSNGGGGRAPRPNEMQIFQLWDKHGLNNQNFSAGNLISFLKQIRSMT